MNIVETIRMAGQTLVANKMRSSLTMLGIIIGNASVIGMVGIGEGAQKLAADQFESLGPNVLFVVPGTREARRTTLDLPKTLVLADAEAIASQVPSINGVAPQINSRLLVSYRDKNLDTLILGVTPEFLTVRSFNIAQGRFFTEIDIKRNNRVAIIGSEIAKQLYNNQSPIGKNIRVRNVSFQIIGVMESKGSFLGTNQDDIVYIPLSTMANQIVGNTSPFGIELSFISITAKDGNSISAAKFQIENLLRLRHKITRENDFDVQTQKDILEIVGTITDALTILLAAIAGISLLVGGIGVMNIMLVSVTERTQEIGLKKALGARPKDILTQFLIEAIILSISGGLLGTIIGISGVILVSIIFPLPATVSVSAIILAVSVSGGIGLFFGVFPAQRAAKLDPIVALRSA
jgi:putative ABC transport system permease protein